VKQLDVSHLDASVYALSITGAQQQWQRKILVR
jgi:hypothetical protein